MSLMSCGSNESVRHDDDILLEAGDSVLRREDVIPQIPPGLSPSDSAVMFDNIVDTWARSMVLMDVARENVADDEIIEKMVEEYRNHLILTSYMKEMAANAPAKVSQNEIKAYYESHKDEFVLESPIVRGIYLKVPESSPRVSDLRKWIFSGSRNSIMNIERYGLAQAMQYEYFVDRWVAWEKVADQIPYRFFDADAFLESTKNFETSYEGAVYFLHISEFQPSGTQMPYEVAEGEIRQALEYEKGDKYMKGLMSELMRKAIEEGRLKVGSYDLFKQKK